MVDSFEVAAQDSSVLSLAGVGVPAYSARGLTQSLEPISEASQSRRTINGELKDLSLVQFQKYKSTVTGNDQNPPACDGLWPGRVIDVECIAELSYETGSDVGAERLVVTDSAYEEGDFTIYRPKLRMMVMAFTEEKDEWGATTSWSMTLEEV